MPEVKYYNVEVTKRVRVRAENSVMAADIGSRAIDGADENIYNGWRSVSEVETIEVLIEKEN